MAFAGIGYPGGVLAEQVKLELPVDQWFLRLSPPASVVSLL
jgi:hypothetical protein